MKARADIIRYFCNDNCAEGGKEITNMNIGITVQSRENRFLIAIAIARI